MPVGRGVRMCLKHGSIVDRTFNLKRYGSNTPWDVSTATKIQLEITRQSDCTALTPIEADNGATGANWAAGVVVFTIGTAVTGNIGGYTFGVTVFIAGKEEPTDDGTIEVEPRPGYPAP